MVSATPVVVPDQQVDILSWTPLIGRTFRSFWPRRNPASSQRVFLWLLPLLSRRDPAALHLWCQQIWTSRPDILTIIGVGGANRANDVRARKQ